MGMGPLLLRVIWSFRAVYGTEFAGLRLSRV